MDEETHFIIRQMKLSIIIPAYNEAATIADLISRVVKTGLAGEIIVVDDGSTDDTRPILETIDLKDHPEIEFKVLYHDRNKGKGAALVTAMRNVGGDIVLIQDADLEYDPRDIPVLLKPIQEGIAEVVYGSRFLGGPRRSTMFWHMVANTMLTFLTNVLYDSILTDMETGYKMFKRSVMQDIVIHARRFDFEPEFTAKILKKKARIFEVPITFNARDYEEGKKIGLIDAFIAVWTLLKYRIFD